MAAPFTAWGQTTAAAGAYGEALDVELLGIQAVHRNPLPEVSGEAPPAFDESASVASTSATALSGLVRVLSTGEIRAHAASVVPDGTSGLTAADTVIANLSLLGSSTVRLGADEVRAEAVIDGTCGVSLSASGLTRIDNGTLVSPGGSTGLAFEPAANSQVFDALGVRIVLNEQVVSGDGVTHAAVAVNAIHVWLDDALLGGVVYDGEIVLGHAEAEVDCPPLPDDPADDPGDDPDDPGDDPDDPADDPDDPGDDPDGPGGDPDDPGDDPDGPDDPDDPGVSAPTVSVPAPCRVGLNPAASLLVPYFEVDLAKASGRTTLLSVVNTDSRSRLLSVTLWTEWAVPTLTFNVYMTGFDVVTVNLRDVLKSGSLPETGPNVSPVGGLSDAASGFPGCGQAGALGSRLSNPVKSHVVACHVGESSPLDGDCAGPSHGDAVARGYVTLDVARRCSDLSPADPDYYPGIDAGVIADANVLVGEVFHVDPGENFAQGGPMVHLVADSSRFGPGDMTFYRRYSNGHDHRQPLARTVSARFLVGGAFDGGTTLHIWRDTGSARAEAVACGNEPVWAPLEAAAVPIWNEEESLDVLPRSDEWMPWAAQEVRVGVDLPVSKPFGWMALDLAEPGQGHEGQGWVSVFHDALDRFSVGYDAAVLASACTED